MKSVLRTLPRPRQHGAGHAEVIMLSRRAAVDYSAVAHLGLKLASWPLDNASYLTGRDARSAAPVKKERGVMYHSRNSTTAPCDNKVVENGTLRKICGSTPPDNKTNLGRKPDESRLLAAMTSPHTSAESGASVSPTEAIPSVAKSEALKAPYV
jgi:hypothetical protein